MSPPVRKLGGVLAGVALAAGSLAVVGVAGGPAGGQTPCPAQTLAITGYPTPTLSAPFGVAVDAAGNIYTADSDTQTVYRFNASGTQTLAIPATDATPTLSAPVGVAVDAAGNIYTADPVTAKVYRFDASGTQTLAISAATPTLSDPVGVAVDAAGNIYISDTGTDTVYRFCTGVPTLGATVGSAGGRTVTVTGSGEGPGATLNVSIASTPTALGTVTADASGAFTKAFTVPCSVGAGDHTVTVSGALGQSASTPVTLTACITPKFTG